MYKPAFELLNVKNCIKMWSKVMTKDSLLKENIAQLT